MYYNLGQLLCTCLVTYIHCHKGNSIIFLMSKISRGVDLTFLFDRYTFSTQRTAFVVMYIQMICVLGGLIFWIGFVDWI